MEIKFKKTNDLAVAPTRGTEFSAGADLYAAIASPVTLNPGESKMFDTGIAVEIPVGCVGLVFARSGIACKRGLAPSNKVGVIDSDYRGEIKVSLHNHGEAAQTVEPGERIAQMVITPYLPCEYVETSELSETMRADGGFGSTGRWESATTVLL